MRDVGYGVGPATSIWPRISPPGKSPGPVFVGATPSFVCTLAYAPAVDSAAIRSLRGWPARGPIRSAAVNVPCASTPSPRPPPGATGPKRKTTIGPFTPAGATWMCAMNTLTMLVEMSRYSTSVPSALSCSLISPTARVSWLGTSFAPVRWATKLLASGTRAASARNASGRCGSVGGLGSQLVLTVTRNSAAVETTTGRMEASRVKSSVLVYLCPRGSQGRGGYPSVIIILPHGPSTSDQPAVAPPQHAQFGRKGLWRLTRYFRARSTFDAAAPLLRPRTCRGRAAMQAIEPSPRDSSRAWESAFATHY